MKLNTKGRYAVMAMADIARHSHKKAIPMAQIAERQQISLPYLEQLFSKLRKAGLVTSMRGPGGGYILAHPTNEIFVGEIMSAVGEPVKMTRCDREASNGCLRGEHCNTHSLWSALSDHIYIFLKSVSLQDVLDDNVGTFGTLASQLAMANAEADKAQLDTNESREHIQKRGL